MSDFTKELKRKAVEVRNFKPRSLNGGEIPTYPEVKKRFGSLAATDPESNANFSLHPDSKKNLGVEAEEKFHLEEHVSREVEIRVRQIQEKAREEGFQQGREEGKTNAETEFLEAVRPQFERFTEFLSQFDRVKNEMYAANEQLLIQLIFQISRSVILSELKTDREFVKRITSQIVEKVGTKENIRLKISPEDFKNVETLREHLKALFPDLKNVQIDPSDSLVNGGVKIETDLSRIDAGVETQLKMIQEGLLLGES